MPQPQILDELQDGFTSDVSFAEGTLSVKTISLKPPGATGDGGISQTTMKNVAFHTQLPGGLTKVSDMTDTVAYAPGALDQLLAMRGVNQLITWTWPDASEGSAWGWIETFEPSELVINNRPTAQMTIMFSNLNDSGVETPPTWVE